jgi:uncharacterized protein (TIGR00369 family)
MDLIEAYEKSNNFGRYLGMKLEVIKPGHIKYTLIVEKNHLAIPGVAHGGLVAGLIDGALGVSGLSLAAQENKIVSTVEFKVNYLRPALIGDRLECEAEVVHEGKRLMHVKAAVINQNNQLIATSSGTFNKYPVEKTGLVGNY